MKGRGREVGPTRWSRGAATTTKENWNGAPFEILKMVLTTWEIGVQFL